MSNLYEAVKAQETTSSRAAKVLSQTYILTGIGLVVTALVVAMLTAASVPVGWPVLLIGVVGLFAFLFAALGTCESPFGLLMSLGFYAAGGFLLYPAVTVAPADIVGLAALCAGGTFVLASVVAYVTKADFSNIGGFLLMALLALILLSLANIFIGSSLLHLALAWIGILVFIGFILFDTSEIIHGRETNYIRAALGMYLNIINLFIDFLSVLSIDD